MPLYDPILLSYVPISTIFFVFKITIKPIVVSESASTARDSSSSSALSWLQDDKKSRPIYDGSFLS